LVKVSARTHRTPGLLEQGTDSSEVFGGRHLFTTPNGQMEFLDAAATCLILVQHDPPINPMLDDQTTLGLRYRA
jgi:hypothetical protein